VEALGAVFEGARCVSLARREAERTLTPHFAAADFTHSCRPALPLANQFKAAEAQQPALEVL